MKRSSIVTLLALGAGGIVLYSLAGEKQPDIPEGGKAYASIAECETGGDLSREQCAKSWDDALTAHEKTAPKYTSLADCEAAHGVGQCATPRHGEAGSYIPLMAAVMMSSLWLRQGYQPAPMLRRPGDPQNPYAVTGGRYAGAPAGTGGWWGSGASSSSSRGSGYSGSTGGGWWGSSQSGSSSSSSLGSSVSTTARGGFGSTGGHFSAGS